MVKKCVVRKQSKKPVCKYLILCIDNTEEHLTEKKTSSASWAQRHYAKAIKSGLFSSVTLRREERTHGYAIKSWSKENGERTYFR